MGTSSYIYKFLGLLIALFFYVQPVFAEGLFKVNDALPHLAICEVKCYGEKALRQEFFFQFEDLLTEQLQASKKFRLLDKQSILPNINGTELKLDEFFSLLHKDAIVHDGDFKITDVNTDVIRHMRNHNNGEKIKKYRICPHILPKLKEFGKASDLEYLLFINLKNTDIDIKGQYQSSYSRQYLKGTKVKIDVDYFLVNPETGYVYGNSVISDKTAQVIDAILIKTGKVISPQKLILMVLENQAKHIAQDIDGKIGSLK